MHEEVSFELCRPVPEDGRLVMEWRNDPHTLRMSYHKELKVWESFWPAFQKEYFIEPLLPPVFGLFQGRRAAFLHFKRMVDPFDKCRNTCDVSVNVAPAFRGRGLGSAFIHRGTQFLHGLGWEQVIAEVRLENRASCRAFLAAGFEKIDETKKFINDVGEAAAIVRFRHLPAAFGNFFKGVFIIAEAGSNWKTGDPKRDLAMGKALIECAAQAGVDAVKFQTYRPETVYVENAGKSDYLSQAGITESIRNIFTDLSMPYEMVPKLAEHCRKCGIMFMSTPFSADDFLAVDPYVAVHKVASYEISHPRLLEMVGASGKPLVLSTGASEGEDIEWALNYFRQAGGREVALMQCTAKYPAPLASLNLRAIPTLMRRFGVPVGLSDHSREPVIGPVAAVALGARVIEKHFTLHNRLPGPDHVFAITVEELAQMVKAVRGVEQSLGSGEKVVLVEEKELSLYARRGLQATKDISAGEVLRLGDNIDILRPGKQPLGLHPRHLSRLEGKQASRDIRLGHGLLEGDWLD